MRPDINPGKIEALEKKMTALGVKETDIEESFIHAGGKGGQKINKTSVCVYLKHIPTGIEIRCSRDRSQARNRFFARRMLVEKIDALIHKEKSEKQKKIEKIRRRKRQRSRRAKEKILEKKHQQSEKKTLRKPPEED